LFDGILPAYLVGSGLKPRVFECATGIARILPAYLVGSGLKLGHARA